MAKIKKNDNFLDLIPIRNSKIKWVLLDNELVQIHILRDGFLDKLVRKFFKTPEIMKIDLDIYGSFIWNEIDGKKSMYEIAEVFKESFGKNVEPLYQRLGTYINILRNNKFIKIEKSY